MTNFLSERYLLPQHRELFVAMALALLMLSAGSLYARLNGAMESILPRGPSDILLGPCHRLTRGAVR
jgi:hypothetical protein